MIKEKKVRCRVAPSPTGKLHLGTAHTALFNYVFARLHKGDFILRIDDTDRQRSKKEFEEDILFSLKWLGIEWDEGPDVGGPYKLYRQSERGEIYKKYLESLVEENKAYYCYCTKEELEEERKEMETKNGPIKYSGKCSSLPDEEKKKYEKKGSKRTIRLKNPNKKLTFVDLIRGEISVDSSLFGDFVIARSDGTALLNFAATIDDIEMEITHAIRGEDFINMVPRQLLIYQSLGANPPEFAHLSFLYAPDKTKLSKRHGATSVFEYKEMGYLPEALMNYLSILGYSMPEEKEFFQLEEFIKDFDIKRIQKGAPIFSLDKLDWYNGHYIRRAQTRQLADQIYEFYQKKYPIELIEKTIPLIQERIKKLSDYLALCEFFFHSPENYEVGLDDKVVLLSKIAERLQGLNDWKAVKIGELMQNLAEELKIKNSEFFMILRVAVTGKKISPPLNESMEILGRGETLNRLRKLLDAT